MADIPYKTVAEKVLYAWQRDYSKHIENDPSRPIPRGAYLDYRINGLSRLQFLDMISSAIEERLDDLKNDA